MTERNRPMLAGHDYEEALVSHRTHMGTEGMGTEWFVRLPDGHLVSCGDNEKRAQCVARCIHYGNIPDYQWGQQ